MKRALGLAALLLLAAPACHDDKNAVLMIVVTASGTPPSVASLDVMITSRAGPSSNTYARKGENAIVFPTTLTAELPGYAAGDVSIEVRANDAAGAMVASGREGPIPIRAGEQKTVYVRLDCGGDACILDGGTGNDDGGMPTPGPRCGNGRVDPGETCDNAIAPGDPGGCPLSCDDHVACTRDTRVGSDCTVICKHERIDDPKDGDGCCPAGYAHDGEHSDSDCSPTCGNNVVDKGETCDTAIPRGTAGACPATSDCLPVTCADGMVISFGTCSAVCVHEPIVAANDKVPDACCPPGATYAVDIDCPKACGNGVIDDSGEHCDPGIPPGAPNACPTSCDDGKACTIDYFFTVGCAAECGHTTITTPISGDGCCPDGATNATDRDCAPSCGNGVVERGEICDGASCPTSCPTPPPDVIGRPGCLRNEVVGDPATCSAHCAMVEVTTRDPIYKDGCCPAGAITDKDDADCSSSCGDQRVQATKGEQCDLANLGAICPTSCDDHKPCTDDYLTSAGTCSARCVYMPVTDFRPGDGCCPSGANFYLDPDCGTHCGDGIVESPLELCDYGTGAGCPGPDTCRTNDVCTTYAVTGRADSCSAACVATPITACSMDKDGCCPPGCTAVDDSDCPVVCGDGVVETSENCDRAITAGAPGACARTCDDGDACTFDQASGSIEGCSRTCSHTPITACISKDGCCPAGCSKNSDSDCAPTCGDKEIGAGETCDPPASCPTLCPDDGDPCTVEQLTGAADTCNAACRHVPIITCSGTKTDSCCPTGCSRTTDSDC